MRRNKNKYILLSLIGILLLMIVGYAGFNSNLKVTETSEVTNNWDISITDIKTMSGTATNKTEPSYEGLTANFDVSFKNMGDYIEYEVTVTNNGSVEANLNDIIINNQNIEVINMTYSGIDVGDTLSIGESKTFEVKLLYKGGSGTGTVEMFLDYAQEKEENEITIPTESRLITYDYETNGGTGEIKENYYNEGENVNLNITGKKEGYTFVGWSADKDAKEALTQYTMPNEDTILYAIYKKEVKALYKLGKNVYKIGKERDSCFIYNNEESCEITLPAIEGKEDYMLGWYNETIKIGNEGDSVSISESITYTAIATDTVKPIITLNPQSQSTYSVGSKDVVVTIKDLESGLKGNQDIYYAWSENSSDEPEYIEYVKATNEEGAKEVEVTISSLENLTGTYYLWIKEGTISDVENNTNQVIRSDAFKFDNTDPSLSVSTSKTTKSITVVANASAESGISKYEYSSNGGSSWVIGTGNTYTFDNLTHATAYNIRVRVTSGVDKTTTSASTSVTTNKVATPTFNETGTTTKTVTITYPSGCGSTFTCSYIKDGGSAVPVTMATQNVSFTSDGTLIAQVNDGKNYITSSTYAVTVLITQLPSLASSRLHLVVYDTGSADAFTSDAKSSITDVRIVIGRRDGVSAKTYWFSSYTGTYSGVGWGLGTGGFGNVPNYGFNAYTSSLINDLGGLDYKMYAETWFTDVGVYPNLYNQNPAWIEFYPRVKISFDANGGTGAPTEVYKYLGRELTLSSTVPVRSGYVFTGWSITNDNIPEYAPGLKLGYNSWNYTQYLHMASSWIDGIGVTDVIEYPEGGAITPTGTNNITLYACWNSIS